MITLVPQTHPAWVESDLTHPKLSFAYCMVKILQNFGKKKQDLNQ